MQCYRKSPIERIKKITLAGKLTLFDNKIETKRAQYNLDRETANISVFSSGMGT